MLQQTRWNRKETAQILGISYKALLYRIKDAGLDKAPTAMNPNTSLVTVRSNSKLLAPTAFRFVLNRELRHAMRSSGRLSLVVIETTRNLDGAP